MQIMNKATSVLLVDDHELILEGMNLLVSDHEDFKIVGMAKSGAEAIALMDAKKPEVIVLDISMPGLNGIETAKRILNTHPNVKILMLSIYDNELYVMESIEIGCKGYVLKSSDSEVIINAIKAISEGRNYYCSYVSQILTKNLAVQMSKRKNEKKFRITERELELIQLICEGKSSKEIAAGLFISVKTVEAHRNNIYNKLNVHNSVQLVRRALKLNLISGPNP